MVLDENSPIDPSLNDECEDRSGHSDRGVESAHCFVIPVYFVNHFNWILSIALSTLSEFKSDPIYRRLNNQKSISELYLRNQFHAGDSSSLLVPETSNTSSTDV
jgi:hypothetical protein